MRLTAIATVALGAAALAPRANDHTWYQAYQDGCRISDLSPATIYENNQLYQGTHIIDHGARVDVIAQGMDFTFFRNIGACNTLRTQRLEVQKQHKQLEEQQEKILDKYR